MTENDFFLKVDLTQAEKIKNNKIFWRIVEAIIVPVLISALLGIGHWITVLTALLWWGLGIYGLFVDKEAFII